MIFTGYLILDLNVTPQLGVWVLGPYILRSPGPHLISEAQVPSHALRGALVALKPFVTHGDAAVLDRGGPGELFDQVAGVAGHLHADLGGAHPAHDAL